MGTFYSLTKVNNNKDGEFGIDEMSNKLNLVYTDENIWFNTEEMSPEELAKIFLEGLSICSYWMDSDKLKELILKHIESKLY